MKTAIGLISILALVGCGGAGTHQATTVVTTPASPVTVSDPSTPSAPTAPTTPIAPPPTSPTTPTPPPPPVVTPVAPPPVVTPPPAAPPTPQTLVAWGNSQTQGYGLADCTDPTNPADTGDTCHSPSAWSAILAGLKGWTLDNQAYGGSNCGDLTYQGTSESMWDLQIGAESQNIYAHFDNEEIQFGGAAYHIAYVRNCIEAQTAWLAIPESSKMRAINCQQTGTWMPGPNSASALTTVSGSSLTCQVTGKTVYLATSRVVAGVNGTYTVSVDGVALTDPDSGSTVFSENQDVYGTPERPKNSQIMTNFIRVAGTTAGVKHTIVYTCTDPGEGGCIVFYAAGFDPAQVPPVYSLSPVPTANYSWGNMDLPTYTLYHNAWTSLVAELQGDGLNILPVDAGDPGVYNPNTQAQSDGLHENTAGHASIGTYAATLKGGR